MFAIDGSPASRHTVAVTVFERKSVHDADITGAQGSIFIDEMHAHRHAARLAIDGHAAGDGVFDVEVGEERAVVGGAVDILGGVQHRLGDGRLAWRGRRSRSS
jgi:hypothetical protein